MNKAITLFFILALNECNAATGNASDGELLAISAIVLMILILGVGYFIDFMKSKIKEFRIRRWNKKNGSYQDRESIDLMRNTVPNADTLSFFPGT